MCLILFAYRCHRHYPLIIAANRDEFHDRPTAPASFWAEAPQLLAGRDLRGNGTWLGITRAGRFAALTNYRDPSMPDGTAPSRGQLVTQFLRGPLPPAEYLETLRRQTTAYNGFNLLFGDQEALFCYSNRSEQPPPIIPGIHGISNGQLDSSWPKVARGTAALARLLADGREPDLDGLFTMLADRTPVADPLLPDTGIGLARERLLAPLFIAGPGYGTRSSTVILCGGDGRITFSERTFHHNGHRATTRSVRFSLDQQPTPQPLADC
jgi:uncharacterized protein with NRDE domain